MTLDLKTTPAARKTPGGTLPEINLDARRNLPTFLDAELHLMHIAGQRVPAASGETLPNIDPATEGALPCVPRGTAQDVDSAVVAARQALLDPAWARMSADGRGRVLSQIADLIEVNAEELAILDSVNMGVPRMISDQMLAESAEIFRYYAGWPTKLFGTTVPTAHDRLGYTRKEPLGVVGIIWGWNGPMAQLPSKLAPALATGNTVVLKPAETASLSTLRLAELLESTDLPAGVINVVTGLGAEAGEALVAHPGVAKIAYTGSTAIGKHVQQVAAGTLKNVTLELGGKSPTVVFADADLEAAARGAAVAFLGNAGQACVAGSRVLVQEEVREEFTTLLAQAVEAFAPLDPFMPGSPVGALATKAHFDRVQSYVDGAVAEGARVVTGGTRYGNQGFFFTPTLIDDVTRDMTVVREEIFGPVGVVTSFTDIDDAIAQANDTQYGLAASVWTTNLTTAHQMAAAIQAGTVWVNTWGEQANMALPFGGYKQSGVGREGGLEVLDAYTQSKAVLIAL
ncbi:aldehyde dehydrogenase family protein [Nocardioides aurantiacus]|uniref:Aldehyde dehydrogenase (NAD+) n=1 Tax=Nocardioides aurantiacus TaxID=86796 RepID=A0A3N2CTQ4_9ACTN|nr:aldehyde dehydrogenase family protein [Nocardioides aurantiacus]ROR90922.1 aldehyde dehydrogenase (NAD+) [Nocardioides aurantiacus]